MGIVSGGGGGAGLPSQWTNSHGALTMAPSDPTVDALLNIDPPANFASQSGQGYLIFVGDDFTDKRFAADTFGTVQVRAPATDGASKLLLLSADAPTSNLQLASGDGSTAPVDVLTTNVHVFKVLPLGAIVTGAVAAPADAELVAGQVALWFDQTNGAAKLMLKGKTANGTVATASVALA